ncbi:MAG: biopolymer transporter ExbD [Akkermansiaceae bacterium]
MRRKRCPLPPEDSPKPDVSSLVDVSFLLLLFFLVTATIEKKEQELTTVIPATAGTPVPPIQTVRVEIDKMGVESPDFWMSSPNRPKTGNYPF